MDFLAQYGNTAQDAYTFPPANGFVIQSDGLPIKFVQQLQPGARLDRFGYPNGPPGGSPGGLFLAPLRTPFAQRALPPSALTTPAPTPPTAPLLPLSNYHVYCVVKAFTVDTGPITAWFAEPSLGTQYKLEPKYTGVHVGHNLCHMPDPEWLPGRGEATLAVSIHCGCD